MHQVAVQRWVDANVWAVVALYEDRHDLWGITGQGRLIRRALPARRAQVRCMLLAPARLHMRCTPAIIAEELPVSPCPACMSIENLPKLIGMDMYNAEVPLHDCSCVE